MNKKNTSLFLKKGEGLGEGKNLFSREKKFFLSPHTTLLYWKSHVIFGFRIAAG